MKLSYVKSAIRRDHHPDFVLSIYRLGYRLGHACLDETVDWDCMNQRIFLDLTQRLCNSFAIINICGVSTKLN